MKPRSLLLPTALLKWWSSGSWSRWWNRSSTATLMDTDPASRRSKQLGWRGSVAGVTRGFLIWISRPFSTALIALCSCGRCGSILPARGCRCTSQDGSRHQCRWRMVASWQEKEERDSENLLSRIDALEHPKAPQLHPMAGPQVVHQAVQSLQRGARTGRTNACETLLRQFTHSKADFPFFPRDVSFATRHAF